MESSSRGPADFKGSIDRLRPDGTTIGRPNPQPSRTWIVMRQAVTTVIMGISLVLAPLTRAGGAGTDATGSIAQARRLIEAKDFAAAMTVLEDLLIEAEAKEKPAIVDLLRQSYAELARQAQLSGRGRDAAHYRDNLAILDQGRPATPPSESTRQSSGPKPRTQAGPKTAAGLGHDTAAEAKVELGPLPAKAPKVGPVVNSPAMLFPEPASLPEPAPMSEPVKIPAPRPANQPLPPSGSSSAPTPDLIDVAGSPSPAYPRQDRDAGDTAGTIAPPAPARSTPPPAAITSGTGPGQTACPKQRRVDATPEAADRLFSAKQYTEAGRSYLALARDDRLPANRQYHWAYCRMVDVAQRINARPQTSREWDEIDKEIQSIQRLAPNLWYGEYLRNKVAEVRTGRRRPRAQSG